MNVMYTSQKTFSVEDAQHLFAAVGWVSSRYPHRLHAALMSSSLVLTAWSGNRLIGLVRALDDGDMTAYVHYVLVDPEFQGRGIAGHLIEMAKQHYHDYLYVEVMPEESRNASFYEQHGFTVMSDGVAMQIVNHDFADAGDAVSPSDPHR